jgi:hypothetical protein
MVPAGIADHGKPRDVGRRRPVTNPSVSSIE